MAGDRVENYIEGLYADARRARLINRTNLSGILSANAGTYVGRKYAFAAISSAADYARALPVTDYSFYAQHVARMAEGEQNILTAERPACFLYTSGTMGVRKVLPLTQTALSRYGAYIHLMPFCLTGARGGSSLHTSVFTPEDSKGGLLLSSAYFGYLQSHGLIEGEYLGGKPLNFASGIQNVPYVKLRLALACENLLSIQSIFMYDALLTFGYLEENWQTILRDMRDGRSLSELPASSAQLLNTLGTVGAERIKQLESIFEGGFSRPVAPKIWPNLRFVSGIGGGARSWQTEALKKYTGNIPLYFFTYTSSEVMGGVALELEKAQYMLLPRSAYYEFIPSGGNIPVAMEELSVGCEYEPVVTTFSGLYRYRTGDIIKITGLCGQSPLFEVSGRISDMLNVAGEKIDEATISHAVRLLQADGVEVYDFVVCEQPCAALGRYVFFMEGSADRSLPGRLDGILRRLSPDYCELRDLGMIDMPEVCHLNRFKIDAALHNGVTAHKKAHAIGSAASFYKLTEQYAADNGGKNFEE